MVPSVEVGGRYRVGGAGPGAGGFESDASNGLYAVGDVSGADGVFGV